MTHQPVERRSKLQPDEFRREYVATGQPVVIADAVSTWPALQRWTPAFFRQRLPAMTVTVKSANVAARKTFQLTMKEYVTTIERHAADGTSLPPPPYLHDVPLLTMVPELRRDLEPFPEGYLTPFYRRQWPAFVQFFMGPKGSLTPLHFDCLETHNLFFQVHGDKRFVLIPREQRKYCYVYDWRWSPVDPEQPDFERFPLYRHVRPLECTVGPGDVLYIPPGVMHHVRGLGPSVSFNIDWHTPVSAVKGVLAGARGMPLTNIRYNLAIATGLCFGVPSRWVLRYYASYLNYVS